MRLALYNPPTLQCPSLSSGASLTVICVKGAGSAITAPFHAILKNGTHRSQNSGELKGGWMIESQSHRFLADSAMIAVSSF